MRTSFVSLICLIALCLFAVDAFAAEAVFELPILGFAPEQHYFRMPVDLGEPAASVESITWTTSGTASGATWTYYGEGLELDCTRAEVIPRDIGLFVETSTGAARAHWVTILHSDGEFSVGGSLIIPETANSQLFSDGHGSIVLAQGILELDYEFANCVGFEQYSCVACTPGQLQLHSYPRVTVVYSPAVPNQIGTWGLMKAKFR